MELVVAPVLQSLLLIPDPLEFRVMDVVLQVNSVVVDVIDTEGLEFTVTARVAVPVQLLAPVTVTVYVVVEAGETVIDWLVPLPPLQLYV